MPKINVVDKQGKIIEAIELADSVFGIKPNTVVMHMAVVNYLANQRQGTQSTLTRSEVSGGGRKPWRQKGTGHARQGSIRAPQWRHGGIALGPKPRDYSYSLTKKTKRLAMKSAFSSKVLSNELVVLNELKLEEYKTKNIVEVLKGLEINSKALIVLPEVDRITAKSANNIKGIKTAYVNTLNVYDILNYDKLIIIKKAVAKIEEVYA
ncbi:MAG: 50S ribosomal protein L4 [Oscillospiraceae bacterium]|nr:50S ribosomal protein L4 [Oscillospiraceae bacterium]